MTDDDHDEWHQWLMDALKAVRNWTDEERDPPSIEDIDNAILFMQAAFWNDLPVPKCRFMRAGGISYTWNANQRNATIQFQDGDIIVTSSRPNGDGMLNLKANNIENDSDSIIALAVEIRDFLVNARYAYSILRQ